MAPNSRGITCRSQHSDLRYVSCAPHRFGHRGTKPPGPLNPDTAVFLHIHLDCQARPRQSLMLHQPETLAIAWRRPAWLYSVIQASEPWAEVSGVAHIHSIAEC